MKNLLKIATACVLTMFIAGCSDDSLVKEQMPDLTDVVPDGINPVQKQKHRFYKEYGIFLLDKFDQTDYKFAMGSPVREIIEPINLVQKEKLAVIEFLREAIYDNFSIDFVRQYFPVKLLLASRIYMQGSSDMDSEDHLFSNSFFAVRANRDFMTDITMHRDSMKGIYNSYVILNLLERKVGPNFHEEFMDMLVTPQEQENLRRNIYFSPKNPPDMPKEMEYLDDYKQAPGDYEFDEFPQTEQQRVLFAYQQGFPNMIYSSNVHQCGKIGDLVGSNYYEYGQKYELYNYMIGEAKMSLFYDYIPMFATWAQNTPEPQKSQLLEQYPLLKHRYEVFRDVIKKHLNLDL